MFSDTLSAGIKMHTAIQVFTITTGLGSFGFLWVSRRLHTRHIFKVGIVVFVC